MIVECDFVSRSMYDRVVKAPDSSSGMYIFRLVVWKCGFQPQDPGMGSFLTKKLGTMRIEPHIVPTLYRDSKHGLSYLGLGLAFFERTLGYGTIFDMILSPAKLAPQKKCILRRAD